MKKIWTIILFFFVVLLLVGCQSGSKDVSEPMVTAPNETISGETEVITVDEIENVGEVAVTTDLELYFDDWGEFDLLALAKDLGFYSYDDEEDNLILFYRYLPDHTEDNTSYVELQLVDGVSLMNIWYTKDAMDEGYYDVCNVVLRGDVDDPSVASGEHMPGGCLGAEEGTPDVEIHHLIPILLGDIQRGDGIAHAGAVDKNINSPQIFHNAVNHWLNLLRLPDVHVVDLYGEPL